MGMFLYILIVLFIYSVITGFAGCSSWGIYIDRKRWDSPYFCLGIVNRKDKWEGQEYSQTIIGLLFFNITFEFYE